MTRKWTDYELGDFIDSQYDYDQFQDKMVRRFKFVVIPRGVSSERYYRVRAAVLGWRLRTTRKLLRMDRSGHGQANNL